MIKSVQITQDLRTLSLLDSTMELWESLRCLICFEAFAWARPLQQRTNVWHWHCNCMICTPDARKKMQKHHSATLKLEKLNEIDEKCFVFASLSSAFSAQTYLRQSFGGAQQVLAACANRLLIDTIRSEWIEMQRNDEKCTTWYAWSPQHANDSQCIP